MKRIEFAGAVGVATTTAWLVLASASPALADMIASPPDPKEVAAQRAAEASAAAAASATAAAKTAAAAAVVAAAQAQRTQQIQLTVVACGLVLIAVALSAVFLRRIRRHHAPGDGPGAE